MQRLLAGVMKWFASYTLILSEERTAAGVLVHQRNSQSCMVIESRDICFKLWIKLVLSLQIIKTGDGTVVKC